MCIRDRLCAGRPQPVVQRSVDGPSGTLLGGSPSADAFARLWQQNPAEFDEQVSRSAHSALERLAQLREKRGFAGFWRRTTQTEQSLPRGAALQLLFKVWRRRDEPAFVLATCDALANIVHDEGAIDELEAYLPQLAHMILRLPADSLLTSVLERFALRVCESNVHWALQLIWIVCASAVQSLLEFQGNGMPHTPSLCLHVRLHPIVFASDV
eukprot:3601070-Pleurochrysis_carterae.AAC.1